MKITVKLEELINHCKEWEDEVTEVEVDIYESNGKKELEISGIEAEGAGLISSDLDPIKEIKY